MLAHRESIPTQSAIVLEYILSRRGNGVWRNWMKHGRASHLASLSGAMSHQDKTPEFGPRSRKVILANRGKENVAILAEA